MILRFVMIYAYYVVILGIQMQLKNCQQKTLHAAVGTCAPRSALV